MELITSPSPSRPHGHPPLPSPVGEEGEGWERVRLENRQISGSPSGVPSPVYSFPPKKQPCDNARRAIARTKKQGLANTGVIASAESAWQSPHHHEIASRRLATTYPISFR